MSNYQNTKTEAHRAAISKALTGRTLSDDHKANISASMKRALAKKRALKTLSDEARIYKSPHFEAKG